MEGNTLSEGKDTKLKSKKDRVIIAKIQNPRVSLKIIAENEGANYCYARRVWANYKQKLVTNKGGGLTPLPDDFEFPFAVQNWGYSIEGPPSWYRACPLEASANRNGLKAYQSPYCTVIFNKKGSVQIYPYNTEWDKKFKKWLSSWMADEDISVFFEYLVDRGGRHYCVSTPGVPLGVKYTIPEFGSFVTDKTPYGKGTSEFEVNPIFVKRLRNIEKDAHNTAESQRIMTGQMIDFSNELRGQREGHKMVSDNMEKFGIGMNQHMKLIKGLQDVTFPLVDTVVSFNEFLPFIPELMSAIKELTIAVRELKEND